jgi:hypothetical protein
MRLNCAFQPIAPLMLLAQTPINLRDSFGRYVSIAGAFDQLAEDSLRLGLFPGSGVTVAEHSQPRRVGVQLHSSPQMRNRVRKIIV